MGKGKTQVSAGKKDYLIAVIGVLMSALRHREFYEAVKAPGLPRFKTKTDSERKG